jgi:hypothetical protein
VVLSATLLCATVTAIHVLDQGGVTGRADGPWWVVWGYRVLEVGGVLTALLLLTRRLPGLAWTAALLVGLGPFVMYLLTRVVGLPGDLQDRGNWSKPLGTVSLLVEAALMLAASTTLFASVRHPEDAAPPAELEQHPRERDLAASTSQASPRWL